MSTKKVKSAPYVPADGVADMSLAADGRVQIALAEKNMGALVKMAESYAKERPFAGKRIAINLHVTKETAVLVRALAAGGAERIAVTGCNAFSTQDNVAAALADEGIEVHARHGCTKEQYYAGIDRVLAIKPHVIVDDGCDLTVQLHEKFPEHLEHVLGGCEQTTSGVIRAKNMTAEGVLKFPLIATNDNKTKHLLDNYYGTGQSVWDGIMRATAMFCAAKTVVVVGYGACGKGIALRAKGLGAQVVVAEIHPFAALQAVYDGFTVLPMDEAAPLGDVFVTATGSKHVVSKAHIASMKDGAMLSNAGQFDYELDLVGLRALQKGESRNVR
jgi:adenosylhomocysteinase